MLPEETFWTWSKLISLAVSGSYMLVVFIFGAPVDTTVVLFSCVGPLALIWFPEVFGDASAGNSLFGRITVRPTPVVFVQLAGWIGLLLPIAQIVIILFGLDRDDIFP